MTTSYAGPNPSSDRVEHHGPRGASDGPFCRREGRTPVFQVEGGHDEEVSGVDVNRPPRMTTARGCSISYPARVPLSNDQAGQPHRVERAAAVVEQEPPRRATTAGWQCC
jgi:hypothetical protein